MKKDLEWWGGKNPILLDLTTGEILSYEQDREEVHARFGGVNYYVSCTGLSGAGYIEKSDLVLPIGYYRVDAPGQYYELLGEAPYRCYAPIASHTPSLHDGKGGYPFVLAYDDPFGDDANMLVFASKWDLLEKISLSPAELLKGAIERGNIVEMELRYFYLDREVKEFEDKVLKVKVINHEVGRGLTYSRFFPQTFSKIFFESDFRTNPLYRSLGLYKVRGEGSLGCIQVQRTGYEEGIVRDVITKISIRDNGFYGESLRGGEVTLKGYALGENVALHMREGKFMAIAEFPTRQLLPGKRIAEKLPEKYEFERWITFFEFHEMVQTEEGKKAFIEEMMLACRKKARQDYVWQLKGLRQEAYIRKLLEQHADEALTIQDSLDSGNCEPGTRSFCEKWEIPTKGNSIKISELMALPQADEFMKDHQFMRVILNKFAEI